MNIEEANKLKYINRELERTKDKKWKAHAQTDKREALIEEWENENGKLTQEQLQKTRAIYDNYCENGKEFKKEYIGIITTIIRERREKIKRIEEVEK